jgi:hypothetical protein
MQDEDFNTAKEIKGDLAKIDGVQAKIATSGAKVALHITNAQGNKELVGPEELKTVLGDSAYNTIIATALASISSELTTRETALNTQFANLGLA